MKEDKIKIIYYKLINIVVDGFDEEEKNIACKEYYNILLNRYSKINIDDSKLNKIIELEYKKWNRKGLGVRKYYLLKDQALDEIMVLASTGYKAARERLEKNILISQQETEDNILKMMALHPLVKEYNQQVAKWHMSEGIMDYNYACGNTDNMSLRMGHYK